MTANLNSLLLPIIILVPYLSILPILFLDRKHSYSISIVASAISLALVALVVYLSHAGATLAFSLPYISYFNINLNFEITSINLILLVMTSIVFFASSLVGSYFIKDNHKKYNLIFAVTEGSSLALFLSGNLFLFYVFWELAEISVFFMIFMFGGEGRRKAAIKFIVYSLVSSLMLLIAIILLYLHVTPHTFDIFSIIKYAPTIPVTYQLIIMAMLVISFLIKMPVFPLHNWLPEAHTEAPTTGSMILAGVLLKFGGYGLILMFMILPVALHYTKYLAILFGFSAIYAGIAALRQKNLKRAIAYTSITDMGIVGIGAAAYSILGNNGALYAMLSHGIVISLLFLIAGTIAELYGTLQIDRIKGVMKNFPGITYLFIFGAIALVGIPLTTGFIGDLLIFLASVNSFGILGIIPLLGVLLIGFLLFWLFERVFTSSPETNIGYHIDKIVIAGAIILAVSSVFLGLFPYLLI